MSFPLDILFMSYETHFEPVSSRILLLIHVSNTDVRSWEWTGKKKKEKNYFENNKSVIVMSGPKRTFACSGGLCGACMPDALNAY